MDSILESSSQENLSGYTEKQKELFNALEPIGFKIRIDPKEFPVLQTAVVDIEHDEKGKFVCVGILGINDDIVHIYFNRNLLPESFFDKLNIIAHNGHSDILQLKKWGFNVKDNQLVHDTELFAHILRSDFHEYGLKALGKRYSGIEYPSYDDIVGKRTKKQVTPRVTLDKQPRELVARYNGWDCWTTKKLYEYQNKLITERDTRYYKVIEKPCSPIFRDMESTGTRINLQYLRALADKFQPQVDIIKSEIQAELGGINLNSPKQVLSALSDKGISPTFHGKTSLDKRGTLYRKYGDKTIVKKLKQWNEISTLLDGFVRPYLEREQEIVHPFFNQCGTRTGRPSCSNPNLLQIPKRTENGRLVRKMFIPRSGMSFGDCDYRAIEPKLLAHLSKDENMLNLFNKGTDFHSYFAERLKVSRDTAKVFDLEVYYRATQYGVARTLDCSLSRAQEYINEAWELFPGLRRWEDRTIYEAKKSGYISTLMGRRIPIDGLTDSNPYRREEAERRSMNNLIQGSAAEVMKLGMQKVYQDRRLNKDFHLLVQVYDQLLAESPDMKTDILYMKEGMENAVCLYVPLTVEAKIGPNWAEMTELEEIN